MHSSGSCGGLWPPWILAGEQAGCARTSLCTSQKVTTEVLQQEAVIFYRAEILLPTSLLLVPTRCFSWQKLNTSYSHVHFDVASKRHTLDLSLEKTKKKDLHNQIMDAVVLNYTTICICIYTCDTYHIHVHIHRYNHVYGCICVWIIMVLNYTTIYKIHNAPRSNIFQH